MLQNGFHRVAMLRLGERDKLYFTLNGHLLVLQRSAEGSFCFGLRDEEHVAVLTPVLGEIEPKDALAFAIDAACQAAISLSSMVSTRPRCSNSSSVRA